MPDLDFDNPPPDPLAQARAWLAEAETLGLENPNAMALSTVDPDGRPSVRMVLLKGFDERGMVFYTNRNSRKGRALAASPRAALLFYWDSLHRQMNIQGPVSPVDDAESDAYFATRPRGAQLGAWASDQSRPLASRDDLVRRVLEVAGRYRNADVPRPPHWGGYRMSPQRMEFWQGRADRLHDRVEYVRAADGGWTVRRLYP